MSEEHRESLPRSGLGGFLDRLSNRGSTHSAADPHGNDSDDMRTTEDDHEGADEGTVASQIVTFEAHIVKPSRTSPKTFQINLYKGKIYQYNEVMHKKVYMCTDVIKITRGTDSTITLDIRPSISIASKQKKLHFETPEAANKFQEYVEYRNDYGACVRAAFCAVDAKATGFITPVTLRAALVSEDLQPTDADVSTMIALATTDESLRVNFLDFFHVFLGTPVYTIRGCLQEWLQRARYQEEGGAARRRPDSTAMSLLSGSGIRLLAGECIDSVELNLRWMIGTGRGQQESSTSTAGTMMLTNYRVCLISNRCLFNESASAVRTVHSRHDRPFCFDVLQVPLNTISRCYLAGVGIGQYRRELMLATKDLRTIRISFPLSEHSLAREDSIHQMIQRAAFPGTKQQLFAFRYGQSFVPVVSSHAPPDYWTAADMRAEYRRQGLTDLPEQWTIFDNSDYSLCESYPSHVAVAAGLTESELREASQFRSQRRLPCVTYRHSHSGAVLTRSAQPLVGITGKSSKTDQNLLHFYRLHGRNVDVKEPEMSSMFYIVDARRQIAATANMASGKGTEDVSEYPFTELIYSDIENIHVMRSSFQSLLNVNSPKDVISKISQTSVSTTTSRFMPPAAPVDVSVTKEDYSNEDTWFLTNLSDSGWIRHISQVLRAGTKVAEKLHLSGSSVLVHCSDGWDRTPQICCIAELILDPFYRTLTGLSVLIEKDWCAFGHKFADRCGQGEDHSSSPDERSPIFLQFLDCMYQMMRQFDTAFEYNENCLIFLADHHHSALFGNFLCNTERQRRQELSVYDSSRSIWEYIGTRKQKFCNHNYAEFPLPIWPKYSMRSLSFWQRYYCRWEPDAHPNLLSRHPWVDDWGSDLN